MASDVARELTTAMDRLQRHIDTASDELSIVSADVRDQLRELELIGGSDR